MLDLSKVSDVELEDVNTRDYPDFADAFVSYAEYDGKPMTNKQLDELNSEHSDWVYDKVIDYVF